MQCSVRRAEDVRGAIELHARSRAVRRPRFPLRMVNAFLSGRSPSRPGIPAEPTLPIAEIQGGKRRFRLVRGCLNMMSLLRTSRLRTSLRVKNNDMC